MQSDRDAPEVFDGMPAPPPADLQHLRTVAADVAALLKALSHEDRLLLLCELSQGERSVGELEERVGLRQPMLSQQLGVLRNESLVATRREGKRIHYRIADVRVLAVLQTLHQQFCAPTPDSSTEELRP